MDAPACAKRRERHHAESRVVKKGDFPLTLVIPDKIILAAPSRNYFRLGKSDFAPTLIRQEWNLP